MYRNRISSLVLAALLSLWGLTHCATPVAAEEQPLPPMTVEVDGTWRGALVTVHDAPPSMLCVRKNDDGLGCVVTLGGTVRLPVEPGANSPPRYHPQPGDLFVVSVQTVDGDLLTAEAVFWRWRVWLPDMRGPLDSGTYAAPPRTTAIPFTTDAPPVAAEVGQPPTPDARYELALPLVTGAPASVFPHCPYVIVEGGYQCLLPLVPVALTPEPPP